MVNCKPNQIKTQHKARQNKTKQKTNGQKPAKNHHFNLTRVSNPILNVTLRFLSNKRLPLIFATIQIQNTQQPNQIKPESNQIKRSITHSIGIQSIDIGFTHKPHLVI